MSSSDTTAQADVAQVASKDLPTRMDPDKFKMAPYKGIMLPQMFEPLEVHLPKVKSLQLRDSDVMLCTYPKSVAMKGQSVYFDTIQDYEKNNPDVSIFHLAYEDMKENATGSIKKLSAHLNVKASEELCSQIAEAVTFNNQKKEEEKRDTEQLNAMNLYRKGESEGWKNHLTVAQSERMDQMMRERAPTCPFFRRYCPSE